MKYSFRIISLLCTGILVVVCSHANASIPYKIKGEVISRLPEVVEQNQTSDETDTVKAESETPIKDRSNVPVDLTNATLTISHEITNEEGEFETLVLVEEHFDGTFEYEGETIEPTEVTISLKISEDDATPKELNTVIGTGQDIHFALLDNPGPGDGFSLIGTASEVLNPENKFTVSGDLSFLGVDVDMTVASLTWNRTGDDGESQSMNGGVLVYNNDSFVIEGDTDTPQVATLYVIGSNIPGFFVTLDVVLEPKGEYTLSKLGNQKEEFVVSSDSGYHALLIDSWQQHEDYLALSENITNENERLQELIRSGASESSDSDMSDPDSAVEDTDEDSSKAADVADASDSDTNIDDEVEEVAGATPVEPAEGCEDAVVQTEVETTQLSEVVQHRALRSKIAAMEQDRENRRTQAIKEIAKSNEDPMARYLAVRLNPWERNDYSPRIAVLRELESDMDTDFVAAHITPLIENMERSALKASNDTALIAGQKVPEFTLVNYAGEDVVLFDLLAENDLVLIDFWASWCGPCIADFPELKKLHAAYADEDFEIVGVSIDSTMEDWIGGVDEHELPWVNLGEVKGWEGPVAVSYGVNAIPKGFLVDSQGCIYEKNIRPRALKEFLVDRYGMDESLEEPEVEETPDVSS